jgi:hypothetical protein
LAAAAKDCEIAWLITAAEYHGHDVFDGRCGRRCRTARPLASIVAMAHHRLAPASRDAPAARSLGPDRIAGDPRPVMLWGLEHPRRDFECPEGTGQDGGDWLHHRTLPPPNRSGRIRDVSRRTPTTRVRAGYAGACISLLVVAGPTVSVRALTSAGATTLLPERFRLFAWKACNGE